MTPQVNFLKLNQSVLIPKRGSDHAAGWDIFSQETVKFGQGCSRKLSCGFSLGIPYRYYVSIVPRSSMGLKGLIIPNSPATIDCDYTGEICILLTNISGHVLEVHKGDRVAQMILHKHEEISFNEVAELHVTNRGNGGFGSTGV